MASHNTLLETHQHNGFTIEIHRDEDPENPRDYDNLVILACAHRRYDLGDKDHKLSYDPQPESEEDMIDCLRESGHEVLAIKPLYLMDHSGISMSTGEFGCRWDSGQVGWGYITKERALEMDVADWSQEKLLEAIDSDVKTYSEFLEGNAYGYVVKHPSGEEESCWGFLGDMEYCLSEAKSVADNWVESDKLKLHPVNHLTPLEAMAAKLLALYWTGAGDAGCDTMIFEFHKWLENANKDESILRQLLEDGRGASIFVGENKMTQTDCFLMLAKQMLENLSCPPVAPETPVAPLAQVWQILSYSNWDLLHNARPHMTDEVDGENGKPAYAPVYRDETEARKACADLNAQQSNVFYIVEPLVVI